MITAKKYDPNNDPKPTARELREDLKGRADSEYFRGNTYTHERVHTVAYERVMHLWCMGCTNTEIQQITNEELGDVLVGPISTETIRVWIKNNKPELERFRAELSASIRKDVMEQMAWLYDKTHARERRMVTIYGTKIDGLLDEFEAMDLSHKDEDDNFTNTARGFIIMEMIAKLHGSCAKITGTIDVREIEIFRQKMGIKADAEASKGSLIDVGGKFSKGGIGKLHE